ncbi:interleukin-8-like [Puntigrus tetrazona]|uniref:interleukin-8-like n=1 Tax=Puntigrus tetrazona TaxID=1606681 RepID=UPI001C899ED9|nr:interleukin-8-like [Puntigrus tetrazona]
MTEFSASAFTLVICAAALLSSAEGIPRPLHLRCECIKTHSEPTVPTNRILSLRVIPAGPHCKNEEIIARMKKGSMCLDPAKAWVISLKEKFNNRSVNHLKSN